MITDIALRRLLPIGLACTVFVALVACATPTGPSPSADAASATATPVGDGPDLVSVGFSTGGSKCALGDSATKFAAGVPVRAVLTMEPALPTGGTVNVRVEKDGTELDEFHQTVTAAEPAPCIYATMHDLAAGHYRISYAITPSQMPPFVGEFDVTP